MQLLFAAHIMSIVCYVRLIVKGDPSGFILVFASIFAQTGTYFFFHHHHGVCVAYWVVSVISTLALIFDKVSKPNTNSYMESVLERLGDIRDEAAAEAQQHTS
ncbi:Uncharacterized protein Adt_42852 [Abeliophyllum distichum]|uniref:Uncharacterized protein n=1 Tax=Abeliophyllum distichum TaxID=126358 RepID=A0ABD1PSU6_9LAMI